MHLMIYFYVSHAIHMLRADHGRGIPVTCCVSFALHGASALLRSGMFVVSLSIVLFPLMWIVDAQNSDYLEACPKRSRVARTPITFRSCPTGTSPACILCVVQFFGTRSISNSRPWPLAQIGYRSKSENEGGLGLCGNIGIAFSFAYASHGHHLK